MMIINDHSIIIISVCARASAKAIAKLRATIVITIVITINGPDHLSDLKDLDDSIFLSESKCYSIFLHLGGLCHPLCSVRCNTNQLILYKVYKDNHLFVCVYLMINFVLDSSTYACHQKDSKLAYLVSEQLSCEHYF